VNANLEKKLAKKKVQRPLWRKLLLANEELILIFVLLLIYCYFCYTRKVIYKKIEKYGLSSKKKILNSRIVNSKNIKSLIMDTKTNNNSKNYNLQAVFALYLNQAEHNLEKAIKEVTDQKGEVRWNRKVFIESINELSFEQLYKLEYKYFSFLRINSNNKEKYRYFSEFIDKNLEDKTKNEKTKEEEIFEIKKKILLYTYKQLDDFRNYYSHFYHSIYNANGENIFEIKDTDERKKFLKEFLEVRFRDAKDYYLNFTYKTQEGLKNKYDKSNFEHLDLNKKYYQFFHKDDSKNYYLFDNGLEKENYKSRVFLASFFLTKHQTNFLLSKVTGFKDTRTPKEKATRDFFKHFCMKTDSDFTTENPQVKFFIDAFNYLNKVPQLVYEEYKKDITNSIENILKNKKEKERKTNFTEIQNELKKSFKNKSVLLKIIDNTEFEKNVENLIRNSKGSKNYKDILKNAILDNIRIRTSKDLFTEFALQFIDDFKLFEKIRFKVYSGKMTAKRVEKKYDDKVFKKTHIESEKVYSRINELENNSEIENDRKPQYFIKNNNVFFEVDLDGYKQNASMSVHELRNLVFALLLNKNVEQKIIDYIKNYREFLLKDLKNVKTKINFTKIPKKDFPQYINKYKHQDKDQTQTDFKDKIKKRLEYIKNTEVQSNIKNLRKYDKIREIIKFVNRFNSVLRGGDRRGYLNIEQHQKLEKLLGTFPNSRNELYNFLENEKITTNFKDFKELIKEKDLYSILKKIFDTYKEWSEEALKDLGKKDLEELKSIGRVINVTEPEYSSDRLSKNIDIFLKNIVIPRGFIKRNFFEKTNISEEIDKKVGDKEACIYYEKINILFEIAKNADKNKDKRKKYKIAKTLNEQKLKDKLLYLMAKKYLENNFGNYTNEKDIKASVNNIMVATSIEDILKDGIDFIIKKGNSPQNSKKIKFRNREFDRIGTILKDKRLNKILKTYFEGEDTIYYINREKYKEKKSNTEKIWDLQDVLKRIDDEQFQIINEILKMEENILINYLSTKAHISAEDAPQIIKKSKKYKPNEMQQKDEEFQIIASLLKDKNIKNKNRIETKELLNIIDINNSSKNDKIDWDKIKPYRNSAYHNGLPENGTFKKGIELIKGYNIELIKRYNN